MLIAHANSSNEFEVERVARANGEAIQFHNFDVAKNYQRLVDLLQAERPDAVVHFAEQRAAPYSMKSSYHKRYTVSNNLNATNNLLAAVVETGQDIHV